LACGEACEIGRQYNPSLPACPNVTCNDTATIASAFSALETGGCATTCTSSACVSDYRVLRAYHDACDNIPGILAIHDLEDACEAAECNTASSPFNPNTCDGRTNPTPNNIVASSSSGDENTGFIVGLVLACAIAVVAIGAAVFFKHQRDSVFKSASIAKKDVFRNPVHFTDAE
jgi:hypothetical protein